MSECYQPEAAPLLLLHALLMMLAVTVKLTGEKEEKIRKQRAPSSETSIRLETQSRLRERIGKALYMRIGEARQVCNVVATPAIAQTGASKRRPYP